MLLTCMSKSLLVTTQAINNYRTRCKNIPGHNNLFLFIQKYSRSTWLKCCGYTNEFNAEDFLLFSWAQGILHRVPCLEADTSSFDDQRNLVMDFLVAFLRTCVCAKHGWVLRLNTTFISQSCQICLEKADHDSSCCNVSFV
jgi:hypothetical protein